MNSNIHEFWGNFDVLVSTLGYSLQVKAHIQISSDWNYAEKASHDVGFDCGAFAGRISNEIPGRCETGFSL